MQEFSFTDQMIIKALKHNNKLTRVFLCLLTGLSDRRLRIKISELRKKKVPIISSSSQKGYWLANDRSECKHFANEILHRIKEEEKIALGVMDADETYFKLQNRSTTGSKSFNK